MLAYADVCWPGGAQTMLFRRGHRRGHIAVMASIIPFTYCRKWKYNGITLMAHPALSPTLGLGFVRRFLKIILDRFNEIKKINRVLTLEEAILLVTYARMSARCWK
jgi:hypothetical protein